MGKRTILLLTALIVTSAALLTPASVAAASGHEFDIVYNRCDGANPRFKVKNIARGSSNANRLTTETWVERKPALSTTWTKVYEWDKAKYSFKINGDQHWLTSWRTWDGNRHNWFRIGFRLQAWHNSNLLSTIVLYSRRC